MTAVVDTIYPSRATAALAAKNDGWRPHPGDRDLYLRGARRIRLTRHSDRQWCWTAITGPERCTATRWVRRPGSLLQHWCTLPPGHQPPHVCGCNATFTTGDTDA